jgi:hypothetical protein
VAEKSAEVCAVILRWRSTSEADRARKKK